MEINGTCAQNGRENWNKMPEPHNNGQQSVIVQTERKDKNSPGHSRRSTPQQQSSSKSGSGSSTSGRTKGVPQSFGYIKRTNGSIIANNGQTQHHHHQQQQQQQQQQQSGGRTAHVSAVPRSNKIKVSGGTQTCSADLQTKMVQNQQHRSFSLTGPGATQLSQSIRERMTLGTHSLPKPGSEMHIFQHRIINRPPGMNDGSLSDTQTYAEVKPDYSTYAMWLKHSNTTTSHLSEGDSHEPLQMGSSNSSRGHKIRDLQYFSSPRMNRSNSIRSTKSEKMYPSMLNRGPIEADVEPYYCLPVGTIQATGVTGGSGVVPWSQPTSPTPPNRNFVGPLSPTYNNQRLNYQKKNDDVHGSAASLMSGGSSLYGSTDERQTNEVRRLKRELIDAREQVMSLSSQLSTNAHVVSAFEQSLSNMTQRLQQLTATAERKDNELVEMRQTIELLRKQSIQAGLTSAHMQSMGVQVNNYHPPSSSASSMAGKTSVGKNRANISGNIQRNHSSDSMCSLNSLSSGCSTQEKKKKKGWLRSSFTKAFSRNAKISKTNRHATNNIPSSGDEKSNMETVAERTTSGTMAATPVKGGTATTITEATTLTSLSYPASTKNLVKNITLIENAKPIDAIYDLESNPVVESLKKQLREKDLVLTDIRLEALNSASQLESLKDTVMKMRAEMINLKQNNERLQKLVTSRSQTGSQVSLINEELSPNDSICESSRRYSLIVDNPSMEIIPKSLEDNEEFENIPPAPAPDPLSPTSSSPSSHHHHHHIDSLMTNPLMDGTSTASSVTASTSKLLIPPAADDLADHTDGKKISICVYLGQAESFIKYAEEMAESDCYYANIMENNQNMSENGIKQNSVSHQCFQNVNLNEFVIAYTYISGKTTWQNLDYIVRKTFKDYLSKIDPGTNLGLNTDSITSYHLGEAKRGPEMGFPDLLPCGYIIGNVKNLYICLQGVGSLAFDSLIPRSIVHRYISLLTEHRRLILCGPSGTGKSYLARKLAEFLVARSSSRGNNPAEAIATFNVDHKSSKELQQYLVHVAEQASMSSNIITELPSVIILDNLHHASALGDVFSCLLSAGPAAKLPCIIGTMSQATCNTTNLQLHHNFRWVLTANHMEPVKGFLARFLRRKLFSLELSTFTAQPQLSSVLAWLPTVWQHINRFLETHSSSDVTIGPRLFLSCPLDLQDSQVWFTDIWNCHLAPYLIDAIREGVQLYGRRGGPWIDPSTYIRDTYPWPVGPTTVPSLRQINAEDVGLEGGAAENSDSQDPLLSMLMRLQEAANYSNNQDQESDCASLDSNLTQDSSAGGE